MLQRIIQSLVKNPRQLFLFDGVGACVSAVALVVIIAPLDAFFGMPPKTVYLLAIFPLLFVAYDAVCYLRLRGNWPLYIRGIAYANLTYVILSVALLGYHFPVLTMWGITYFVGELIIVLALIRMELQVAARLRKK